MAPGAQSPQRIGLIRAAMAGDQAAVLSLLAIVQPDIRRFARSQCRSPTDADDAAQEALWALYRRVGMLRVAEALSSWLFAVVRHACLRLAGSALYTTVVIEDLADDARLSHRPTTELRLDVAAGIGSLPRHYREIVVLRDLQELTIAEIAVALGLSREAVKGRLHRARGLLREYLTE